MLTSAKNPGLFSKDFRNYYLCMTLLYLLYSRDNVSSKWAAVYSEMYLSQPGT